MSQDTNEAAVRRFRTLFISDVHLGSKSAKADHLIDFLRYHEAETIVLIGDIVDGWRLKRSWYWPQDANDVVQKLLRKARKGTRIIYIPGNHDEFLRDFPGIHFGGIEVKTNTIHEAADGKRYLVLHGDEFDVVVRHARFLAYLGDWAYDAALGINIVLNVLRRRIGMPYWSFSAWAKHRVKQAVNFIGEFQKVVAEEARRHEVDGVICGHIHHAAIEDMDGITYINSGDWVESCTAIGETLDGEMTLLTWRVLRAETTPTTTPPLLAPPVAQVKLREVEAARAKAQRSLPLKKSMKASVSSSKATSLRPAFSMLDKARRSFARMAGSD